MSEGQWVHYFGPNTFEADVSLDVGSRSWQEGHVKAGDTAIQCLGCQAIIPFGACPNCGHPGYKYGYSKGDRLGVFCAKCERGTTSVTCECGTANPISIHTIVQKKKGGCFVATAAYGDPCASEVVFLSGFRDRFLATTPAGRQLIQIYYQLSPRLAAMISRSTVARLLIRWLCLKPIVVILRILKPRTVGPE
jgi:hypothetical protein